ncbi:uncharacterized protein FIESC28_09508 [Fusarium coffeatum]|uniref:Uncharacterized protein n=1 Tax=Fusarium coffeatum TaxID=231269 RepID=A0A366R1T8_9HYPO|nr:uncharacterized protein FIESC28_09508 [Fusarium coffeatum]RBR10306.1 hypothetical protein FIESC28_09508 [Fusarium coffeatum]
MVHSNNSSRIASNNRRRKFRKMSISKKEKMEMSWRRPTNDDTGKSAQIKEQPQASDPGITQKLEVGERKIWEWPTPKARVPGNTPDPGPVPLEERALKALQMELAKKKVFHEFYTWQKHQKVPLSPVEIWVYEMRRLHFSGHLLCTEKEFEEGHPVKTILKRGET